MIAAIVGAGPLATALASTLAARGRVRHVRLIDDAATVAAGKALDVRQSTPVLGTDVGIEASGDLGAAADAHVILIADAHGTPAVEWDGELGLALIGRLAAVNGRAPIVCTGGRQASLVERGVGEVRLPWTRIFGSAAIAFDAAARAIVAEAAGTCAAAVSLALAGLPPSRLVIGWSASSIDGAPAESRLAPAALATAGRHLTAAWPPGPFALAAAAALLLEHLDDASPASMPALVATPAQGYRAGIARVRVGPSGILHAADPALSPYERIALDNALAFRRWSAACLPMVTALVVVVVLTVLTALYVAAEFSAISVRRSRVRQMAEDGHFLALRLAPFVADARKLDTYIAASQIGITLTSLILGAYGQAAITPTITRWLMPWADGDAAWALSVASIATLVTLTTFNVIVGELVPKTLALQHPTPVALATVMPMLWSLAVYRPFIGILNGSGNLILRLFGVHQSGHRHVHSPEELELLIAESRDGGLLEPDEHRRLQRALRLRLRSARELMVPWHEIEVVDVEDPLWQVIDRLSQSTFTRVPVFRGERTRVVGIVNTKRLALRRLQGAVPGALVDLVQPSVTTSPTTTGDRLLALFQQRRTHHAIVSDDNGQALGLVTLEDVLRAFLGEMPDDVDAAVPVPGASGG